MKTLSIQMAADQIKAGKIIAAPTEAVYGLSCDPDCSEAIENILAIKQRPIEKGLILLVTDLSQVSAYIEPLSEDQKAFCDQYWPGPVTILLPAKSTCSRLLRGDFKSLAVRLTAHPVMCELIHACGHALVSTSANLSGQSMAYAKEELDPALFPALAGILEGDLGNQTDPSMILDLNSGNRLR